MSSLRLVINGLASHFARRFVNTRSLDTPTPQPPQTTTPDNAVAPRESYEGRYYDTDLGLGTTETADDIHITSAVCKVAMTKRIVTTAITGRDGTVKEYIAAEDYEIEVNFTIINTADEYPAEAMRQLATLAREKQAVYVDSEFLRLFDIDRVVIKRVETEQTTYGNTQTVKFIMDSDDEYDIAVSQA